MELQILLEEAAVVLQKPRARNRAQKRAEVVLWEIAVKLSFCGMVCRECRELFGMSGRGPADALDFMSNCECGEVNVFWMPRDRFLISVSEFGSEDGDEMPF